MSIKLTKILAVIVLLAGYTTAAMAQQAPAGQRWCLSDQQQEDIRDIFGEFRPRIQSLQTELQQAQQELQSVSGANADEGGIREKAAEIGELSGEMTALSVIMNSRIQDVFTEDQRQTLEQLQAQQQQQMQKQQQQQMQQGGQTP